MKLVDHFKKYGEFRFEDENRGIILVSDGQKIIGGKFKVKNFRKNQESVF